MMVTKSSDRKISKKVSKKSKNDTVNDLVSRLKQRAVEEKSKKDEPVEEEPVKDIVVEVGGEDEENSTSKITHFNQLELVPELIESIQSMKYAKPTPIQAESIPHALKGHDIIGLAQTGSGKTAAFAIPILQSLALNPSPYFACVLAPTRELAFQISETFKALGSNMGVRCVTVVGGMDMMDQSRDLMKKPHIIIATPGRLMDHLEHTKGFNLRALKFLVMDEADRLLDMDFGPALDKILAIIPKERTTYLFSATMTSKIEKLQRASLSNPVRVAVSNKYSTVDTLVQTMMITPDGYKNTYLIYLLNEFIGKSIIVFTRTCAHAQRTALLARMLDFKSVPLHGQLSQSQRLGALNKFKAGQCNILIATDVAARGLDIPSVDIVINYDLPTDSKSYIHRVGRTARAGRSGKSISLVTQYDLELYLRIEQAIDMKLPKEVPPPAIIKSLHNSVDKALTAAITQTKEYHEERDSRKKGRNSGKSNRRDDRDREER